ncbi:MAG TPA: NTP transferase domain-containing protein [Desulfosalsimonadaceae bacterium]|nr:NTP transferase domain-containing protein [Desulfosalsimonadaceae bacterium]
MESAFENIAAIILAAGKGTRMKSDKAKVLHMLAGRPIIGYVIETAVNMFGRNIIVVIGNQAEAVRQTVAEAAEAWFAYQHHQLGTGHAVQCALPELPHHIENVIILCGDVPLITEKTLNALVHTHLAHQNAVTLLGVNLEDPSGYGRLVTDPDGNVIRIVEEADATELEKGISTINSGIYCIHRGFLEQTIAQLKSDNAQNELYLTDLIEIAATNNESVGMIRAPEPLELLGINTLDDLKQLEALIAVS